MTALITLRATTRRYINEEDSDNSHFTDDEINDYLNQGVMFLGTQMEWPIETATATAVLDQALYTLPDKFISLTQVFFDNVPMTILDRADLIGIRTDWQNAASAKPYIAYKADNSVVGIYPAPDSDNAGLTLQVQTIVFPDTLSQDTDVPDLHDAFQMCLPFYAAFLCDHKMGNDKKSDLHLQRYDQHRKALMSKVQRFSDDLLRFRWVGGYQ